VVIKPPPPAGRDTQLRGNRLNRGRMGVRVAAADGGHHYSAGRTLYSVRQSNLGSERGGETYRDLHTALGNRLAAPDLARDDLAPLVTARQHPPTHRIELERRGDVGPGYADKLGDLPLGQVDELDLTGDDLRLDAEQGLGDIRIYKKRGQVFGWNAVMGSRD
jgi:hypothetical protein